MPCGSAWHTGNSHQHGSEMVPKHGSEMVPKHGSEMVPKLMVFLDSWPAIVIAHVLSPPQAPKMHFWDFKNERRAAPPKN